MTDETIVAVFDTADHAGAAVRDLLMAKVPKGAIDQSAFRPGQDIAVDEGTPTSVSVTVKRAHVIQVIEILESHNPVDLDEPALAYGDEPALAYGDDASLCSDAAEGGEDVAPKQGPGSSAGSR